METATANVPGGPAPIMQLATAFYGAKVLLSAVELGLFTLLSEGPATEATVRERLGLHSRGSQDFLDALVALSLLERDDERYRNSRVADHYLDRRKPSYLGGFLDLANRQFPAWGQLTEALRTGEPQLRGLTSQASFGDLYQDPDAIQGFMAAMDAINAVVGPALAERFDWSGYDSFVDLGGARGNVAAALVEAHPHLRGGCFDLPPVEPVFDQHMTRLGLAGQDMAGQVRFFAGDFFTDPLPEADVLIFGHVLHDWDLEERQTLIKRAFSSVRPGGALLVYDPMIDDDRCGKPFSLLLSLNMILSTPGGSEYTVADCRVWLEQAGFTSTSAVTLTQLDTLVIARKAR